MDPDQNEAIQTDEGESYTPPAGGDTAPQAPAPQAAAPQQPQGQLSAIPDVGEPAYGAAEGAKPFAQGMQEMGQEFKASAGRAVENVGNTMPVRGVKAIYSYLMGAGGTPHLLQPAADKVDPAGSMSDSDRNIMAVHKAAEMDGPAAAWQLVQSNRIAYNAKQAFAYAAMNGTQGKKADLNAAIQAANDASSHVLDGQNVRFDAGDGGSITATVNSQGAQPQTYNLNPQQFREYLNVGRTGQWDRLMQPGGVGATLQKLTSANAHRAAAPAAQPAAPQAQQQTPAPQAPADDGGAPATPAQPQQTNFGDTPSTLNLSGNKDAIPDSESADKTNYGAELEARAMKMFPSISQEGQRQQWMAGQEQQSDKLQNAVDVAKETGENRVRAARETGAARVQAGDRSASSRENVATTNAAGRVESAKVRVNGQNVAQALKAEQQGSKDAAAALDSARKAIAVKRQTGATLTPDDEAVEKMLNQRAQRQPQRAAPATPQAPTPQAKAPQPSGNDPDAKARAWLQANPDDPRAAAVRQKLGM